MQKLNLQWKAFLNCFLIYNYHISKNAFEIFPTRGTGIFIRVGTCRWTQKIPESPFSGKFAFFSEKRERETERGLSFVFDTPRPEEEEEGMAAKQMEEIQRKLALLNYPRANAPAQSLLFAGMERYALLEWLFFRYFPLSSDRISPKPQNPRVFNLPFFHPHFSWSFVGLSAKQTSHCCRIELKFEEFKQLASFFFFETRVLDLIPVMGTLLLALMGDGTL